MAELSRLPGPTADLWDWQLQGACRTHDTEDFFHPQGERGAARRRRIAKAKKICAECPVIASCRQHALAVREPYGVWGGLSEDERLDIYNHRKAAQRLSEVSEKRIIKVSEATPEPVASEQKIA